MSADKIRAGALRRHIGTILRNRRLELGFSQEEVAWRAGVAQGSISNYEIARNDIPLTVLVRVCHALRVSPTDLLPFLAQATSLNRPGVDGSSDY